MKLCAIAFGVAAGLADIAQAAENTTTLYGALRYEVPYEESEHKLDLNSTTAKIGVRGAENLTNGLQAVFKFEWGFATTPPPAKGKADGLNKTRAANIGLKGAFGTLTLGKQGSLYKSVTDYNNIYKHGLFRDKNHYMTITGGNKLSKAIKYVSPTFSGLQAGIAAVLDGSHEVIDDGDKDSFNAVHAGLWYGSSKKGTGLYAGLAYSWTSQDGFTPSKEIGKGKKKDHGTGHGSNEVLGGAVGYRNERFQIGLGAEHAASLGEKYNLAGQFFQGANTFRASVDLAASDDVNEKENVLTYGLGYQYNFSKRTFSYMEGNYTDWNDDDTRKNGYIVRIGLNHDF